MNSLFDTPIFNFSVMKELLRDDALYRMVAKDLQRRGYTEDYALEIIFNSYVLDDTDSLVIYQDLLSKTNKKGK